MKFRTGDADYVPLAEGVYFACLVGLVHLGTEPRDCERRLTMQFELRALPGAPSLDENGRTRPPHMWMWPMSSSLLDKARLAELIAGWDNLAPDDIDVFQDVEDRLGRWARARITHYEPDGRVHAHIATLAPLQAGDAAQLKQRQPYNKPHVYNVRQGRCEYFKRLPGWLQTKARESLDWPTYGWDFENE